MRWYNHLLQTKPLRTNLATASFFSMFGDFTAQTLERRLEIESTGKTSYNYERTARMGLWGICSGFAVGHWYAWLTPTAAMLKLPPMREMAFKLFFDQMLFQPFVINSFFTVTSLLEGKSVTETKMILQNKSISSWLMAVPFWSSIMFCNFRYSPLAYQPIVVYAACVFYNTGLSLMAHHKEYGTVTERALETLLEQSVGQLSQTQTELAYSRMQVSAARQVIVHLESDVPSYNASAMAASRFLTANIAFMRDFKQETEDADCEAVLNITCD